MRCLRLPERLGPLGMSRVDDAVVRVGGGRISAAEARGEVTKYLAPSGTWSYPAYDDYQGAGTDLLSAPDLLSPMLLNVSQPYMKKYRVLTDLIDELNGDLKQIPKGAGLTDATADELERIVVLFGILDRRRAPGVQLTTLSKVLHRVRPNFIPLYDNNIRRCYQELGDKPSVPPRRGRSWADFTRVWLPVLQADLVDQWEIWSELASLVPGRPITPLRALDIVGWSIGRPRD